MKAFVTAAQVQERPEVDKATKNALKAKKDDASKARKAKENEIKATYGKRKEEWPPDQQEEYFELEEAAALAEADYEYRVIKLEDISDSVLDVSIQVGGHRGPQGTRNDGRVGGGRGPPRPGAPRQISDAAVERVVTLTLESKPKDATRRKYALAGKAHAGEPDEYRAYLACIRLAATIEESFQALYRPASGGEDSRHRRSLPESSRTCSCTQC